MHLSPLWVLYHREKSPISGDMNALIGKDENTKFFQHNLLNRNGEHQTDFHSRTVFHAKTQNYNPPTPPKNKRGKPRDLHQLNNAKPQLIYILIKKKWINCALNCELHSSFEGVSSDCWIVSVEIKHKQSKPYVTTSLHSLF